MDFWKASSMALGLALMVGCGGGQPPVDAYTTTTYPVTTTTTTYVQTTTTTTATATPTVQKGPCAVPQQLAMEAMIEARAKGDTPASRPADNTSFKCETYMDQGEVMAMPVVLQPGKCYSVIGVSMGNITELDVVLKVDALAGALPPGMNLQPILAQDSETGPQAVIGSKNNCWKNPFGNNPLFQIAVPARIEVTPKQGAGSVAVKLYSR